MQMVDDRVLALPQQETDPSKKDAFGLPSAVALVPGVVGAAVVADDLVRAILFARDTPDLSAASEVGVRGGESRCYKASFLLSTERPLVGRGF